MGFPYAEMPKSGFTGYGDGGGRQDKDITTSHDVITTSAYKIYVPGTKMDYYNKTLQGYGTCIYLRYSEGGETLAAGMICQPDPALDSLYYVTGDCSTFVDLAVAKPNCIALSAMTTTYWGWFWCSGVCPDFFTSATARFDATTTTTDTNLTAGEGFCHDGTAAGGDDDGFLQSYDVGSIHTADNYSQAGWTLADDASTSTDMGNLVMIDFWP